MKLLTKSIERKLKANAINGVTFGTDHKPVVKFFGGGACTWLISEMHPDTNRMYGLCDLGHGSAELGYVMLEDLEGLTFQIRHSMNMLMRHVLLAGLPLNRETRHEHDSTQPDNIRA